MASPQQRHEPDKSTGPKAASGLGKKGWVKRDALTGRLVDIPTKEARQQFGASPLPPRGEIRRITLRGKAKDKEAAAMNEQPQQADIPIWEKLLRRADAVPASERSKLPIDGARNVDHYLYGHKKSDE